MCRAIYSARARKDIIHSIRHKEGDSFLMKTFSWNNDTTEYKVIKRIENDNEVLLLLSYKHTYMKEAVYSIFSYSFFGQCGWVDCFKDKGCLKLITNYKQSLQDKAENALYADNSG